jgi:hypothetical protein
MDDLEVAVAAREAGFRAIVYKCHHESTVTRSYYTRSLVPGLEVYGNIVLNPYVGYVNPAAVEASLRLGGKIIWMPTADAGYHAFIHGSTGSYGDTQSGGVEKTSGYWTIDDGDHLKAEFIEVLQLIAEHNAVLATCSLSPTEITRLVPAAKHAGVDKILITRPFYKVPNLDVETLGSLVQQGAMPEFIYTGVSPFWADSTIDQVTAAISRFGASNCLLVSDCGQRHNPMPPEALRIFSQMLFEKGISQEEIEIMIKSNPAQLLGLDNNPNVQYSPIGLSDLTPNGNS